MTIGRMTYDIAGLSLTAEDKELLQHPYIGGLILFARNYESPQQVAALVDSVRQLKPDILISVDQEGGRVQRLTKGFTKLPCLRLLGQMFESMPDRFTDILEYAKHFGRLMALEVQSVGIDLSFAPVVDCDKGISLVIGDRAFHHDPKIISIFAEYYIKGMYEAGMSATIKHFPGHGGVEADSHVAIPLDDRSPAEIMAEMLPFKALVKNNIEGVDAVMPAHVIFKQVDSKPVGFSKFWLQDVLRDRIGFKGAIISDDLSMEGAKVMGNMEDRANAALVAGCDMLLVCNARKDLITLLDKLVIPHSSESGQRIAKLIKKPKQNWQHLRQQENWQQSIGEMAKFLTELENCKVA